MRRHLNFLRLACRVRSSVAQDDYHDVMVGECFVDLLVEDVLPGCAAVRGPAAGRQFTERKLHQRTNRHMPPGIYNPGGRLQCGNYLKAIALLNCRSCASWRSASGEPAMSRCIATRRPMMRGTCRPFATKAAGGTDRPWDDGGGSPGRGADLSAQGMKPLVMKAAAGCAGRATRPPRRRRGGPICGPSHCCAVQCLASIGRRNRGATAARDLAGGSVGARAGGSAGPDRRREHPALDGLRGA